MFLLCLFDLGASTLLRSLLYSRLGLSLFLPLFLIFLGLDLFLDAKGLLFVLPDLFLLVFSSSFVKGPLPSLKGFPPSLAAALGGAARILVSTRSVTAPQQSRSTWRARASCSAPSRCTPMRYPIREYVRHTAQGLPTKVWQRVQIIYSLN